MDRAEALNANRWASEVPFGHLEAEVPIDVCVVDLGLDDVVSALVSPAAEQDRT